MDMPENITDEYEVLVMSDISVVGTCHSSIDFIEVSENSFLRKAGSPDDSEIGNLGFFEGE